MSNYVGLIIFGYVLCLLPNLEKPEGQIKNFYLRKNMATIRITDLQLRTIIGINDWERKHKQDIVINVVIEFEAQKAIKSDHIEDTVDYKTITKNIINFVEKSRYKLLEKLTAQVLNIVMEDKRVLAAQVRIDKPQALRFTKSVSIELRSDRHEKRHAKR